MNEITTSKEKRIQLSSCGIMLLSLYFGEQIRVFGIPVYIYFFAVCIITILKKNNYKVVVSHRFKITSIRAFSIAWVLVGLLHFIMPYDAGSISSYIYCVSTVFIIMIITSCIDSKEDIDYLMVYMLLGTVLTCVTTILELKYGIRFTHSIDGSEYYHRIGAGLSFGFQVNVNDQASLLVASIFAPLYFLKKKPAICMFLIAVITILVIIEDSRMCILAMLAIAITGILVFALGRLSILNSSAGKYIIFVSILIVLLLFIMFFTSESLLNIISDDVNFSSDSLRIILLSNAIKTIIGPQILLGNGPGLTQILIGNNVHCIFVEILCDYGFLVFLWLIYILFELIAITTKFIKISTKAYIASFLVSFILLGFCSSSMLRIHVIWAMLTIVEEVSKLEQ